MPTDATQPARKKGSIRDAQKASTRKLLESTAMRLFRESGYARTTVDQIVTEAGASRGTFYLHFESKAHIVQSISDRELRPALSIVYQHFNETGKINRKQFREWLQEVFQFCDRYENELVVFLQANALEDEFLKGQQSYFESVMNEFPGFVDSWPEARRNEMLVRHELMFSQITKFVVEWTRGAWNVDRETALTILVDTWSAGILIDR